MSIKYINKKTLRSEASIHNYVYSVTGFLPVQEQTILNRAETQFIELLKEFGKEVRNGLYTIENDLIDTVVFNKIKSFDIGNRFEAQIVQHIMRFFSPLRSNGGTEVYAKFN